VSGDVLSAIAREVESDADADEVLRSVVALLAGEPGIAWAGIAFFDDGRLTLGPESGALTDAARTRVPVLYRGDPVAELWVDGDTDQAVLERVAELVSSHCLVGWDTGGETWDPSP
jgi:hypothetical protein